MTIADILADIRFLTRTDSNEYTNAAITIAVNSWYQKANDIILSYQDGWDFDDPKWGDTGNVKTYNLTADTQNVDIDTETNKIIKLKRVEVTYDGTNWYKAEPMDINEFSKGTGTATNISGSFTKSEPYYDMVGEEIFLYPTPTANVTNGLKLWFSRDVDVFTSAEVTAGTVSPGLANQFHRYLSVGAALDYAVGYNLENKNYLANLVADYEERMKKFYGRRNEDRQFIFKGAEVNYE